MLGEIMRRSRDIEKRTVQEHALESVVEMLGKERRSLPAEGRERRGSEQLQEAAAEGFLLHKTLDHIGEG